MASVTVRIGTVILLNAANWENRWGEHRKAVVQRSPLPSRDHQPPCVVVLPVPRSASVTVEEIMRERGVVVRYESIRRWCAKFGQAYATGDFYAWARLSSPHLSNKMLWATSRCRYTTIGLVSDSHSAVTSVSTAFDCPRRRICFVTVSRPLSAGCSLGGCSAGIICRKDVVVRESGR